jgi:hypothetical protein
MDTHAHQIAAGNEMMHLLNALTALKKGEGSVRLPAEGTGLTSSRAPRRLVAAQEDKSMKIVAADNGRSASKSCARKPTSTSC